MSDFKLFGTDLFGEEIKQDKTGIIRQRFDFPPFTVLNAREGSWQERKRAWLACGIKSEVGRGENLLKMSDTMLDPSGSKRATARAFNMGLGASAENGWTVEDDKGSGTSIFDPVLAELCYRWFCPPGGMIVDPFAGGSVRGVVAGLLGFQYHGIDLRPEQIEANEAQRNEIAPTAPIHWVCGDSNQALDEAPEADMIFSCPPYGDLEVYSDNPDDLSTMTYPQFLEIYQSIIEKSIRRLKNNRFAAFVIGEYRDPKTGAYRGFVPATCAAFMLAGADFYNEAVLVTSVGSLALRVTKQFETTRKMGKALRNGTPILTPSGWRPIEQLAVGDLVFSVNGLPTAVTGVFPQGQRDLFQITFNDGAFIDADRDHLWFVADRTAQGSVLTTQQILDHYGPAPKDARPYIPQNSPILFERAETLLDPYLVGALLGDGGLSTNTPFFTSVDQEIVERVSSALPSEVSMREVSSGNFILAGTASRSKENPLTAALRTLGLMGHKANTKFVPKSYLFNDIGVRLAVLRGLMDTDGCISGRAGVTEFCSVSEQLAEDVAFLARSLGARVKITSRVTKFCYKGQTKNGQRSYIVRVVGGLCPFSLSRKALKWQAAADGRQKNVRRTIVSILPTAPGHATCISVADSSRLFIADHFIVTHNTHQTLLVFVKGDPKIATAAITGATS